MERSLTGRPEGDGFYRPAGVQPRGAVQAEGSLAAGDGPGPGQRIAHFTLRRFIAKGGMGEVWEAFDEDLRRAVALELVLPERIDARSLALSAREAQAGGRLAHPSIVTTLGHGTDGGRAWIAQELVEGSWTLEDFLDGLRAADAVSKGYHTRVAGLVAQLADALHAAHLAGVIHRDVKPQNILIAPDETPKLADFGLARVTDDSFLSITGEFAGTYAHMSPEQVSAKRMGLDHRTDIFSPGIVLYELLSLRRPFEGDTTHQIAAKIVAFDPPEPSKIRSQCPREPSIICGKALEKDPDRRYRAMAEFAADLRRHLANEPIHARPPGPIARAIKRSKRNPGLSSEAGVGAVALLGGRVSIGTHLGDELHLALKERATILTPVSQGLTLLGWRIYRGTARLRPENARRTRRRLRHRRWELRRGRLAPERYVEAVRSVLGRLGQGDTLAWRHDELVALWADESELGVGSPRLQNLRPPRRQLQQRRLERAFGEPQRRHAGEPHQRPRPPALQGVAAPDRVGPALAPRP